MNKWTARRMCSHCHTLLTAQSEGSVHSVFSGALNFSVENQLFALLRGDLGLSPYSVLLGEEVDFKLVARRGERVKLECGKLFFEDGVVELGKSSLVNLAVEGVGELGNIGVPKSFLDVIAEEIEEYPHAKEGIAPLIPSLFSDSGISLAPNHVTVFLASPLENIMEVVANGQILEAVEKLADLAGGGIGLTPSTDDFIVGVMASLYRSAYIGVVEYGRVKELGERLYLRAKEKTVEISAHFIGVAVNGLFNENMVELITTDFSLVTLKEFRENVKKILQYGFSSGADMLTGYYFGLRLMGKQGDFC